MAIRARTHARASGGFSLHCGRSLWTTLWTTIIGAS
jgi:hypothetical protein